MAGSGVGSIMVRRVLVLVLAAMTANAGLSCASSAEHDAGRVTPIETAGAAPTDPSSTTPSTTADPTAPTPERDGAPGSVLPDAEVRPDTEARFDEVRAELDDALLGYDRALTALVGRPAAAADPADPLRVAWDRAVGPSTAFSSEMLAVVRQRFEQDRIVILPDASGLAYRHHALIVTEPSADTVSFTWCGHSPGIGYDAESGAVVDDGVAHARGTGLATRVEGRWRIDSLDEFELQVLAPGSPDPCPAEVADPERRR